MSMTPETENKAMKTGYRLTEIRRTGDRETSARVEIDPEAAWFSGHFPGNPIVPGVIQLAMAFELVQASHAAPVRLSLLRRVRFKQIIRPGDRPDIAVRQNADGGNTYSFRLMLAADAACTGTLIVEEEREKQNP